MPTKLIALAAIALTLTLPSHARAVQVLTSTPESRGEDPASIERAMKKYPPTARDVVYGHVGEGADATDLKMDIFAPHNKFDRQRKAIVVIHGGSWAGYDKTILAPVSQFLQKHGFVVFSINYRLAHDGHNTWPAQLDDAQRAVRWIRAHAQQYNIDPDHVGAFGHSSGAQMASMLGEILETRDNSDPALAAYSSHVQAVVDASGPTDFLAYRLPDGDRILANLIGAPADQAPAKWQAASPIWNVTPKSCPFFVIHGKKDREVYMTQSQSFVELLKLRGVPVRFVKTGSGHTYATVWAKFKLAYGSAGFFKQTLGS
jgi:acetyl esterase/lipase